MPSVETQAQAIDQLIGAVLQCVVRAQGMMASQIADFVEQVGFETDADGKLTARTFDFAFDRSEANPVTGEVEVRRVTATLPLLSIVNLPSLVIDEATVDLDVQLVAFDPQRRSDPAPEAATIGFIGERFKPPRLFGVTARKRLIKDSQGKTSAVAPDSTMKVSIRLRNSEAPLGIEKLISMLDSSETETEPEIPG